MGFKIKDRKDLYDRIISILKTNGAKRVLIFGSYVRGEETPESDLDLIVDFIGRKSLLDIIGIEQELTDALGINVDLLTEKSISPYLISNIRQEAQVIYG